MQRIFKLDSINKKLIAIFLTLVIIPLILTVIIITIAVDRGFTKQITNQQDEMEHIVQTQFDKVSSDLLDITQIYAENDELVAAYEAKDREQLLETVNQIYPRLEKEHDLEVFEFGDLSGTVFLRGHNPKEYGDDKSTLEAIQQTLLGNAVSGFEFGSSGLAVRAFAPIISNGEVIGTLQTGVNDSFINELNQLLEGVTIDLYNQDGLITISSNDENIGESLDDTSILTSVIDGETVSNNDDNLLTSYIPMYDPMQSEVIGVIGINQDMSVIHDTNQQITLIAWTITVITLIIVLLVSIKFSKSISNPIKQITKMMRELSDGNLKVEINKSKRNDELAELTNTMQVLRDTLHDTIEQVAASSSSVSTQSVALTQSATEVKSGSEQIMLTMQELASGAEKQADSASELASKMGSFARNIQESNEKGKQIQESSSEILKMSNEGETLMVSSEGQMMEVDKIVQDAVQKMDQLDKQAQQISKLISIIQDIAAQTNLLSLNAQIEAARAGESGKGFTVVANEVGRLSEQVSTSVTDIIEVVNQIQTETTNVKTSLENGYKEVTEGTNLIKTTSVTFHGINEAVSEMVADIKLITENLSGFAVNSQEVNFAVEEIVAISEESAAGVEETSATSEQSNRSMERVAQGSEELTALSETLDMLVRRFKV